MAAFASFALGYLHHENSSGGAAPDFAAFHWPAVQLFTSRPWLQAVRNYPSATNPLAYLLASLARWTPSGLRAASTVLAAATAVLLASALRARLGTGWMHSAFGGSLILLSPAFRSTAFWANTDPPALFFAVLTSLLLSACIRPVAGRAIRQCVMAASVAVCAAAAFYTRQFYLFVPITAAWMLWRDAGFRPAIVAAVFILAGLPELWLMSVWHGLNPPAFHDQARLGWSNVALLGTNLALFSAPLLAGAAFLRRRLMPAWWSSRATLAWAASLLVVVWMARGAVWPGAGGGLLEKAGLRMGWLATPAIVATGAAGLTASLLAAACSGTNALLAASFLPPFLIAYPVYERYFDPAVLVAVLLFADVATARAIGTLPALTVYFLFSLALLQISLLHFANW